MNSIIFSLLLLTPYLINAAQEPTRNQLRHQEVVKRMKEEKEHKKAQKDAQNKKAKHDARKKRERDKMTQEVDESMQKAAKAFASDLTTEEKEELNNWLDRREQKED